MSTQREPRALFGEIRDWMLAPLLLLWPMSVFLIGLVAQGIANNPYARNLGEMARTLARQVQVQAGDAQQRSRVLLKLPEVATEMLRADDTDRVFFQILGARGEFVAGDRSLPVPEEPPGDAQELHYRDDTVGNDAVRVAYLWLANTGVKGETPPLVQVAETLDKRSQLANEIIKGVVFPQFIILPLAVLLVWFALARGISPLNELQQRIRQRQSQDLSPIDPTDAPEEVAPLVGAINDLLSRLDHSLATQKRFLADAAHQLKTPLAGLRMQAELAQREIDAGQQDPRALKRSLQQIALSSQRAAHLVNQLLALARAEDQESARRTQEVNLAAVAREAVHDFVPRALEQGIDLGFEGAGRSEATLRLDGQPLLVREMIRNLVDNALQYTPAGGSVTVRVLQDMAASQLVLQVEDTGPGIAQAEREQVFQPFYRVLGSGVDGSGLGLAIVREIARQHGAQVLLSDAPTPGTAQAAAGLPGTLFTLRFAAHAPAAAGSS